MNNKELEQLFKILSETDINTFELEKANFKIKIKRGKVHAEVPVTQIQTQIPVAAPQVVEGKSEAPAKKNIKYIVSPMVGTFYRAPSPEAQPYIEKGDKITKDQVMCIIEAMKLFNEIESDVSGAVVEILVENGQPVEYGEKLFAIDIS
jgi:acetyl-CoA carboxylase biotin carboxyl carrier protein